MEKLEGIRSVRSEEEAERIASQYEKAISRTSNYVYDRLAWYTQRPDVAIVEGFHENDNGSFVVAKNVGKRGYCETEALITVARKHLYSAGILHDIYEDGYFHSEFEALCKNLRENSFEG